MPQNKGAILLVLVLAMAALVLCCSSDTFAQCAMCRAGVAAGGEKSIRTMNLAMLVLLIPPVTMFCSVFALVYKYRKPRHEEYE